MADNTADVFSAAALRKACDRVGGTKKAIAAKLGITPTALSSLLNGRSTPSMERLHKMVDVFGGSVSDYLELPPRQHWELKHYRLAGGFTQAALAGALDMAPSAVSGWELGTYPPSAPVLPRLAALYAVSEEQLRAAINNQYGQAGEIEIAEAVESSDATLALAEKLAETVLGFAASATSAMGADQGISAEARDQLNTEIRARAEEALGLLAALIPQLPEGSRTRTIRLVGKLSAVYDATFSA